MYLLLDKINNSGVVQASLASCKTQCPYKMYTVLPLPYNTEKQ